MMEISFDTEQIGEQLGRIKDIPYAVQKALYPALRDTMDYVRDSLAEKLMQDVPLPKRYFKRSIKIMNLRASSTECSAVLNVASSLIPLIHYDVQPMEITARGGLRNIDWPGFTFALRDGKRRPSEEIGEYSLPFIANMPNRRGGHMGVYTRTAPSHGKPQGQIKEHYGPRLQYHATTPEVEAMLLLNAENYLVKRLSEIVDGILE